MCLYIDDDGYSILFRSGERRARVTHHCTECSRDIEPGETYHFWVGVYDGDFQQQKMCAHCWGTIDLGATLTGCPRNWWWDFIHDLDPEMGFVGNCLGDEGHDLGQADRYRLLRTVVGRRRRWRDRNGRLYPIPTATRLIQHIGGDR